MILLGAGWSDLRHRRVPNRWLLSGAAAGIFLCGPGFLPPSGAVLLLSFLLFRLGMLGAGDGKVMALTAGYLGMTGGLYAIGAGLAVGAVWSICLLLQKGDLFVRLVYLSAWIRRVFLTGKFIAYEKPAGDGPADTVPLAACLAVGTFLYLAGVRLAETGCL